MKQTMFSLLGALLLCAGCMAEVGGGAEEITQTDAVPVSVAPPTVTPAACRKVCETRCHRDRFGRQRCEKVCRTVCR